LGLCTLQWLREEVADHLIGWAILDTQLTILDSIANKEVPNVDMMGAMAAGCPTILFQQHGTHVVLIHNVVIHSVPLSFHEVAHPNDQWHSIIDADYFRFE
jgi:hypothetical protein